MPIFIVSLFIMYLLGGCSITPSPAITQYTILPSYHQGNDSVMKSTQSIRIHTTEILPSLATKNIRYTLQNSESGAYLYGRWSDTPSMMLSRHLASSLESEKLFSTVIASNSTTHSDWALESDLMIFEHRFMQKNGSQGVIDLSCRLIDTRTKQYVATKRFLVMVKAPSEDLKGGVIALQQASDELTKQQLLWLESIIKNIKK